MSKFLDILEEEGYEEGADNPLVNMKSPLTCNITKLLGAAIEDILERYSSMYDEYLSNGVIFDFEKAITLPTSGLSFNLCKHIEDHLDDLGE